LAIGEQANKTWNGTVGLVASPPYGVGSVGVVGNGFAIDLAIRHGNRTKVRKATDSSTARSSTDVIEPLSRIATKAPKSLKSERPDFSIGFCRLVDQTLRKKPMLRPPNFERIVAQFGNA